MGHPISRYWGVVEGAALLSGAQEAGLSFVGYVLFNAPAVLALALPPAVLAVGVVAVGMAIVAPIYRPARWLLPPAYVGLAAISLYVLLHPYGYRSVHGFVLIAPGAVLVAWFFGGSSQRQRSVAEPVLASSPSGPARPGRLAPIPAMARTLLAVEHSMSSLAFFRLALLAMTVIYAGAFVVRSWAAAGGLQWGPRYMLGFYPLYVAAGLVGLARAWPSLGKAWRMVMVTLYLIHSAAGLGFQVRGAYALWETVTAFARAGEALRALPAQAMVTRCTWMPMVIPDLYWTGKFFALNDLAAWTARVEAAGVSTAAVVDMDVCQNIPLNEVAGLLALNPTGITADRITLKATPP
jgi:hypothetical protein